MLRDVRNRPSFPLLVFLALLLAVESGLFLAASLTRPSNVTVQAGATSSRPDDRTDSRHVDAFMVSNLRLMGVPGAMVAIVRDGRILHAAGYGRTADGLPVTPDTRMPIASLTKSFTAAAIMTLVEAGTVVLDTPVRAYVPEFAVADPRGARITIRQLLNQSSGLAPRSLPPRPAVLPRSLADQVRWLRSATLVSEPGAAFNYCNENYNVLALVVERVSKTAFGQFFQDRLFTPLGMSDTQLYLTSGEPMRRVALGHLLVYGVPLPHRMQNEFMAGGGGLVSTANDLARWLVFQNTGGRTAEGQQLLSPTSLALMHTPSVTGSKYGFGWEQESLPDGTTAIEHSGKAPPYVAHQQLAADGYSYALVLNASHSFNAEPASFIMGLHELVMGRTPSIGAPYAFFGLSFGALADHVVALLTIVSLTIGLVGSMRARAWAARRAAGKTWRAIVRCLPYAGIAMAPATFPFLLSVINRGAPVPWDVIAAVWPPLPILVVVSALAGAAIAVLRLLFVWQRRSGATHGAPSKAAS
jgi:CubicO group peptidase (beta-lactamase class C family)